VVLLLLWLAPGCASPAPQPAPEPRLVFEVEVDCERARDQVWLLADTEDDEVMRVAMGAVHRRLDAMGLGPEVEREPGTRRVRVSLPRLTALDQERLQSVLRSFGVCELFFIADEATARARGIDLAAERERLRDWRAAHPGQPLELFNYIQPSAGGPARGLAWYTAVFALGGDADVGWPVLLPERPADHIGASSFARVWVAEDDSGKPALGYELSPDRAADLERVTAGRVGQRMAVMMLFRLVAAPQVRARMRQRGLLEGQFTREEAASCARAIQQVRSPLTVVSVR